MKDCFLKILCMAATCILVATHSAYSAELTFDNTAADSNIKTDGNWAPDYNRNPIYGADTGIVPTGYNTIFQDQYLNNLEITFQGNSSVRNGTTSASRMKNSHFTFEGTSSWINQSGTGNENLIIGYSIDASSLTWNSSGTLTQVANLDVGQGKVGTLTQTAGTLNARNLAVEMDGSIYHLSGGTMNVTVGGITFDSDSTGTQPYINFTTGSSGSIVISNGGADYSSTLESYITNGSVRKEGQIAAISDFDITYDAGTTTLTLIPEPLGLVIILQ